MLSLTSIQETFFRLSLFITINNSEMATIKGVIIALVLGAAAWFFFKRSQKDYSAYQFEVYKENDGILPYRILYPKNFERSEKYPLIYFLHGSGEMGNDNKAQLALGADLFLKEKVRSEFPSVVIFPQCSAGSFWSNVERRNENNRETFYFKTDGSPTRDLELLMNLTNNISNESYIDASRIYIMGISMGGMGVLEI